MGNSYLSIPGRSFSRMYKSLHPAQVERMPLIHFLIDALKPKAILTLGVIDKVLYDALIHAVLITECDCLLYRVGSGEEMSIQKTINKYIKSVDIQLNDVIDYLSGGCVNLIIVSKDYQLEDLNATSGSLLRKMSEVGLILFDETARIEVEKRTENKRQLAYRYVQRLLPIMHISAQIIATDGPIIFMKKALNFIHRLLQKKKVPESWKLNLPSTTVNRIYSSPLDDTCINHDSVRAIISSIKTELRKEL